MYYGPHYRDYQNGAPNFWKQPYRIWSPLLISLYILEAYIKNPHKKGLWFVNVATKPLGDSNPWHLVPEGRFGVPWTRMQRLHVGPEVSAATASLPTWRRAPGRLGSFSNELEVPVVKAAKLEHHQHPLTQTPEPQVSGSPLTKGVLYSGRLPNRIGIQHSLA